MAASDARPVPKKNVAYRHYFAIRKNDGTLITTWAGMDSQVSQDGGTMAAATNEATEIATNSGTGYLDLTASEMNNDAVVLKVTVTNTDALPYVVVLYPEEAGDIRTDVTQVGGSTQDLPTATALATAQTDLDTLTGSDGVTLATAQGNYAPAKAGDAMALTSGERTTVAASVANDILNDGDGTAVLQAIADQISADWVAGDASPVAVAAAVWNRLLSAMTTPNSIGELFADNLTPARMQILADWSDGGRLDAILDSIRVDTNTDIPGQLTTAQNDLDILTGADGVNLLSGTQTTIDAISTLLTAVKAVTDALPNSGALSDIHDNIAYVITALIGATGGTADSATETFDFTLGGTAYRVTGAGLDAAGNRGTFVLSKP